MKSSVGAIPIGRTMNRKRKLLRHVRHIALRSRVDGWCGLTPRDVRTHLGVLVGNCETTRLVVSNGSRSTQRFGSVPMPWRKLSAATSHDISRLRSRADVAYVGRSQAEFRSATLPAIYAPKLFEFHAPLTIVHQSESGRGIRVQGSKQPRPSHTGSG